MNPYDLAVSGFLSALLLRSRQEPLEGAQEVRCVYQFRHGRKTIIRPRSESSMAGMAKRGIVTLGLGTLAVLSAVLSGCVGGLWYWPTSTNGGITPKNWLRTVLWTECAIGLFFVFAFLDCFWHPVKGGSEAGMELIFGVLWVAFFINCVRHTRMLASLKPAPHC